jgi:hypothetical protein
MADDEVADEDQYFKLEFNAHRSLSFAFALSIRIATALPVHRPDK